MRRVFIRQLVAMMGAQTQLDGSAMVDSILVKNIGPNNVEILLKAIRELGMNDDEEFRSLLFSIIRSQASSTTSALPLPEAKLLKIPLPTEGVILVDSEAKLREAHKVLVSSIHPVQKIAIDSEWRPETSRKSMSSKCSIVQIACKDHSFIFDLMTLKMKDMETMFAHLLQSTEIVKLVYNFQGDLKRLKYSFPEAACFEEIRNVVDLAKPDPILAAENNLARKSRGLSDLAKSSLGFPLCKRMQRSDWEQRPLSSAQIEYAALDAYVLLMIYERLREIGDQA